MKKTKIMPVMTAVLLASSCVLPALDDIRTVNAQVTEDAVESLAREREEFFGELKRFDDSGYFEAAFSDYREIIGTGGSGYSDENFRGKCVPYIGKWNSRNYLLLTFPEAKDELTVTFKSCNDDARTEILRAVTAITGGTFDTYYVYSTGIVLADDITSEMFDKVKEVLKPYVDEGKITDIGFNGEKVKYKDYTFYFDRLCYNYNSFREKEDYDFASVAEYLKGKGENCRIIVSERDDDNKMYVVETEKDTPEERCRIGKLIFDEFGYEFSLGLERNAPLYDYRTENFIPEYYTTSPPEIPSPIAQDDNSWVPKHPSVHPAAPLASPTSYAQAAVPDYDSIVYGDLNGDGIADVTDLSYLSLYLIGDSDITDVNILEAADVQNDGTVNLSDLALFRQYLSKKVSFIGRTVGVTDITDKCTTVHTNGSYYTGDGFMVSSMKDYQEYMASDEHQPDQMKEKGLEVSEEFFKDHRLAVMIDKSLGCNGVNYTLTSVKESENGDVHLYYDRFFPSMQTEIAGTIHYITVVPDNPHNGSRTYVHYNDIHEHTNLTGSSRLISTTSVEHTSGIVTEQLSGIVSSMDEFNEKITSKGIKPTGAIERFGISEEFFKDNSLVYFSVFEGHLGPAYRISDLDIDYKKNLKLTVERYEVTGFDMASPSLEENWFLAAAVPKTVLDPAAVESFRAEIRNSDRVYSLYSDLNTTALVSNSETEFVFEDNFKDLIFTDSWFEMINESLKGRYSHLKDEFITEDFFDDNALLVLNQPAEKTNIRYSILNLSVNNDGTLEVLIGRFVNAEEKAEDSNREWHLAAAIPKDKLVLDKNAGINITYHTQQALLGSFS